MPLVVREIPGTGRSDAISPYSYPGAKVSGGPVDPAAIDLGASGLVSAFVRDRLGEPAAFSGATDRSVVLVSDPAKPRKSRMSDRQQIRKNEAAGYEISSLPALTPDAAALDEFLAVYTETMRAVDAAEHYFFDADYFRTAARLAAELADHGHGPEGGCAAAALLVRSDGFLHYYLSGTADAHRRAGPFEEPDRRRDRVRRGARAAAEPRRRRPPRRRPRGVQAWLRQHRAALPDPRADLRPRRLRRAQRRPRRRRLLPALPAVAR